MKMKVSNYSYGEKFTIHPLVKNMYVMSVLSSSDFYSSHVSVLNEWSTNYFVTETFMNFGSTINYPPEHVTKSAGSYLILKCQESHLEPFLIGCRSQDQGLKTSGMVPEIRRSNILVECFFCFFLIMLPQQHDKKKKKKM